MKASEIVRLHTKAKAVKGQFTSKNKTNGNMAAMEVDGKTVYAHSSASYKKNPAFLGFQGDKKSLILKSRKKKFKTKPVANSKGIKYDRDVDSEAKLFEYAATIAADGKPHTIRFLSQYPMCVSCTGVQKQFSEMFPDCDVKSVAMKAKRVKSKYGNDWKKKPWEKKATKK